MAATVSVSNKGSVLFNYTASQSHSDGQSIKSSLQDIKFQVNSFLTSLVTQNENSSTQGSTQLCTDSEDGTDDDDEDDENCSEVKSKNRIGSEKRRNNNGSNLSKKARNS